MRRTKRRKLLVGFGRHSFHFDVISNQTVHSCKNGGATSESLDQTLDFEPVAACGCSFRGLVVSSRRRHWRQISASTEVGATSLSMV